MNDKKNHRSYRMITTPLPVLVQHYLPQRCLTSVMGRFAHCHIPWIKNTMIHRFIRRYGVNMDEAQQSDPTAYPSFHDFFIRPLKPGIRPIDPLANGICSPCDGTISQIGSIDGETLIQAKNHTYTLSALLAAKDLAKSFENGRFITIYLAPKDYHRVHMPMTGTLEKLSYLPGQLFSVNPLTTQHVDQLFARNERIVTFFKNDYGSFAIILIGAMIVGSIYTRWGGALTPHRGKKITTIDYPQTPEQHIKLAKGDEMGYFSLGSTVILLFAESLAWEYDLTQQSRIVVGQRIGHF